jgi:hypothetical protein
MYYRTERTVRIHDESETQINVRTYTLAKSPAEARVMSRQQALSASLRGKDGEILGIEAVIEVPGVTSPRDPEVLVAGRWRRVKLWP